MLYFGGVISNEEFKEQTKNYKMQELFNPKEIRKVLFFGDVLERAITNNGVVEIISYNKKVFLNIIYDGKIYLYNDKDYQGYRYFTIKVIAFIVIIILIIPYIYIFKKLRPLKKLKKQIDKFANNKLDEIENVSTGEDEISQVSNAFYQSVMQIRKLNQSRQFFLINIMHELKTPITKGLITLEMIENNKYKARLNDIFNRLEILINEFAAIEQITSGATFINNKKYNILDILDEAKEISMNEDNIQIFINNSFFVNVDFKLFATVIKNMIDNGIKYSDDKFVSIYVNKNEIIFVNKGKAMNNTLEYYTQAFTQEAKSKDSFGLGLYIVDTILQTYNLKLYYEYKDGSNYFYFKNLENILVND